MKHNRNNSNTENTHALVCMLYYTLCLLLAAQRLSLCPLRRWGPVGWSRLRGPGERCGREEGRGNGYILSYLAQALISEPRHSTRTRKVARFTIIAERQLNFRKWPS